jgi:hypothetical protein
MVTIYKFRRKSTGILPEALIIINSKEINASKLKSCILSKYEIFFKNLARF